MRIGTFDNITAVVVNLNRITGVRTLNHSNTWFWLLLSCFYKAILISCFLYSLYANSLRELEWSKIAVYMIVAIYLINTIIVFLSTFTMQILGWQYYKEMSLLRKNIAETEQSLMKLNIVIDHRKLYMWIVVICSITVLNALSYCIYYIYTNIVKNTEKIYILGDALLNIMIYIGGMVVLDFSSHVCWLEENFKHTNDFLKKFFIEDCSTQAEDWDNKMIVPWLQRCPNKVTAFRGTRIMKRQLCTLDKINMLQQIRYIHLQLCLITRLLNKIFDTQIIFHSIVAIYSFIMNLYIVYVNFATEYEQTINSVNEISFYVINGFYVWLRVAVTCYFCEKTAKEAKQIVHVIHACCIHNSDIELINELTQFFLQVSLAEMDRKDTHLFWLNDGFILQSIGVIFTYFVIMIQWGETLGVFGSSSNLTTSNHTY